MKSICFFHPSSDLYGSDKILLQILQEFAGYQRTVFLCKDGPLVNKIQSLGDIKIIIEPKLPILARKNLHLRGIISFIWHLISFWFVYRKHHLSRNEIIYLNTIATTPILAYFNRRHKRIIHLHEITDNTKIFYKLILLYILRRSDTILCVSDAVKRSVQYVNKYSTNKIHRIYNGIPIPVIIKKPIDSSSIYPIQMALIGRIKPSMKGQHILIEAIAQLKPTELDQVHFLIIGSTVSGQEYMLDELHRQIHDLQLEQHVTIHPFIHDIATIYSSVDVILVPSICEDSLPTTILEAMSFGRAVIGTRSGGIPEMIKDQENGLLVDKNNVAQLHQAILYLLNNPSKITQMGVAGRQIFEEKFTEEVFHVNYQHFISNILLS